MKPTPGSTKTFWQLFSFLKPRRGAYFASLLGLALVLTAERMFIAYVIKLFVDSIASGNLDLLWNSVKTWAVFLLGWIPMSVLFHFLWRSVTARAVANLRETIFKQLQRLPLGYYEERHSGDLASVLTNDVSAVEQAFQQDMLNLVNASLQGISAVAFMLVLNWQLAVLVILSGLVPLAINALFAGPLRKTGETIQASLGGVSERLADLLGGYQVVRSFNLAEWILGRFSGENRDLLGNSLRRVRLDSTLAGANEFGGILILLMPLAVGSYMVLQGLTTFGTLVAIVQLNGPIQFFVYSLGGTISRIQGSLAAADRILAVLNEPREPLSYAQIKAEPAAVPDLAAQLEFSNVHFAYAGGKEVLKGMSFTVRQGQVAAFVGSSGGGKSTIFKLLLGCYPLGRGNIFIRQQSLNTYRLAQLRDLFAYIPQDSYLYAGSILENIRYGKPGASKDEVYAAAHAAYAHEFISGFSDGYDTLVGERGVRLSGGQRQRMAIARALLKNAPVLLLDEATSALDSESEELVQQALGVLMRGRTVLVIAHRISTIEHAHTIYVVDGGVVGEAGNHQELLDQKGMYYHLHALQFHEEEEVKIQAS